jgi:hypothetical protein
MEGMNAGSSVRVGLMHDYQQVGWLSKGLRGELETAIETREQFEGVERRLTIHFSEPVYCGCDNADRDKTCRPA